VADCPATFRGDKASLLDGDRGLPGEHGAIDVAAFLRELAGLGYELGHHAVVVAQSISHYGLWISIGLVVVIVFFQVRSQRHMLRTVQQARRADESQS